MEHKFIYAYMSLSSILNSILNLQLYHNEGIFIGMRHSNAIKIIHNVRKYQIYGTKIFLIVLTRWRSSIRLIHT